MSRKLQPALSQGSLSAIDRAAVLLDSYNLAKAGLAPVNTVLLILVALQNEKSSTVFSAMSMVLGGLHLLTEQVSPECHAAFVQLGSRIITAALRCVDSATGLLYIFQNFLCSGALQYRYMYE